MLADVAMVGMPAATDVDPVTGILASEDPTDTGERLTSVVLAADVSGSLLESPVSSQ